MAEKPCFYKILPHQITKEGNDFSIKLLKKITFPNIKRNELEIYFEKKPWGQFTGPFTFHNAQGLGPRLNT